MAVMNVAYPRSGRRLSVAELRKISGKGPLFEYLKYFATRDVVYQKWDFLEDTINLDYWALANSGGTSAADFAIQVLEDGVIRGDTGTTDNGSLSMVSPIIYSGDRNAGVRCRFKVDAVTSYNFEFGFVDAVPGSNGPAIADVDTPTATATDCAVFTLDTDQTDQTLNFVTAGSTFTTTPTACAHADPVAATYMELGIQLIGNSAVAWINGQLQAEHSGDYVEGGNLLAIWTYWRTRNTTAKFPDFDYIEVWKDRNV